MSFVTWPPGHLATLPPGHLTTWPPGHLATWPPDHLRHAILLSFSKLPSLNPSLGFHLSTIHLPPDKQLICSKYVPVVLINFLVDNLCSRESSGGPRSPSPYAARWAAARRASAMAGLGDPRGKDDHELCAARQCTGLAAHQYSSLSPRPNPSKESLAAPRELRGNGRLQYLDLFLV